MSGSATFTSSSALLPGPWVNGCGPEIHPRDRCLHGDHPHPASNIMPHLET